jgi:hypothetical protein
MLNNIECWLFSELNEWQLITFIVSVDIVISLILTFIILKYINKIKRK